MKDIFKARHFLFFAIVAVAVSGVAAAQSTVIKLGGDLSPDSTMYYIPERNILLYDRYLQENTPPLVYSVKVSPEAPGPGDEIRITAEIRTDPLLTENKTLFAFLKYTADGGKSWKEIEMDQESGAPDLWSAAIPPTGESCELRYYFTASDDAGNYLAELPVTSMQWGAKEYPDMTSRIPDEDDDARVVDRDLDILEGRVGFDGENYYFGFKVEGKASSGTVTPFEPFIYSVGIFLPERMKAQGDRPDYVVEHAQHAQFVRFPVAGLLDVKENFTEIEAGDPRFYYDGNWLFMRMNPKGIKEDFDHLKIIFGTAKALSYTDIKIKTIDVTGFVNIAPARRVLAVK